MYIRALDKEALRTQYRTAAPFPFICIDNFLEPEFANQVAGSYPSYADANQMGREFRALNENRKIQICEYEKFPDPAKRLADALSDAQFLNDLSDITGIQKLLWDHKLGGGGLHQTASSGLLDVHVDFNRLEDGGLFRRLNLLLYLNPVWDPAWGGLLELWDQDVKQRRHAFTPVHNRCVIFETSEISFHGVTAVKCPGDVSRKSFAAYYYTKEAPPGYAGVDHTTVFKMRPDERLKGYVLMPANRAREQLLEGYRRAKRKVKQLIGRT
jgi:hypothetical protein